MYIANRAFSVKPKVQCFLLPYLKINTMSNFFDIDLIILYGTLILLAAIKDINPWIFFFSAIIAIIAGIYIIISLHYDIKIKKDQLKKLKGGKE